MVNFPKSGHKLQSKIYLFKHVILEAEYVKKHMHKNILPIIDRDVIRRSTPFVSFSPFYKAVEEKRKIKGKTMVQWIKLLQNNSFIN